MRKRWLLLLAAAAIAVSSALVNAGGSAARTADVPTTTNVYAWIGLKNSDDVGTRFDIKAEVTNGTSEGYGTTLNVSGGSSGFNNAKLVTIPVSGYTGTAGQAVSVTIWVRVACASGHASGTARLWWNDGQANSRVNESPGFGDLYLSGTNTLSPTVQAGPKKTKDVLVKKNGCPGNTGSWQSFGTWTADIDLSLDLTMDLTTDLDGDNSLTIGDRVTFTLTLDNAGINAAANVHVADVLPPGYHFLASSASQGTYTSGIGDWNVGAVSVPSTPTLRIVATVIGGHPASDYTNYAQVSAAGGFDPDSTPANNSTTEDDDASFTPPIADLSIANAVALAPGGDLDVSGSLTAGDQVVFTVTVSNAGPDPAPGAYVVNWLGNNIFGNNGFTYVGDDSLGTYDGVTGIWVVGTIAPGTTRTLHVTATVNPNGPYRNTAQVTRMGDFPPPFGISLYLDPDSTPNNNVPTEDDQATVTPTVQPSS